MNRVALGLGVLVALAACGKKDDTAAGASAAPAGSAAATAPAASPGSSAGEAPRASATATATATASAAASAPAPAASGESTGMPACDEFLAKFAACMPGQGATIDQMRSGFKMGAVSAEGRGLMEQTCKQQLSALGDCGGSGAPPVAVTGAPTPPVALGSECDEFKRVMDCLMTKMPPDSRAGFKQTIDQVMGLISSAGGMAGMVCKQAIDSKRDLIAQLGCATPGDTPPGLTATAAPPPPAATTPGGVSPAPTLAEWDAQTREVAVTNSSRLNCETKMVREWLRVSCRGKNDTGGTPQSLTIQSGGDANTLTHAAAGTVTSLVVRYVPGIDLKVLFLWSDKSSVLRVWWPRGAPEPQAKGAFEL
ncbi:MAG: hypothetical protein IT373_31230 [Polyangiaceae bacterium]|nr:hypothetical protein [Polyangiaceae bacterium]